MIDSVIFDFGGVIIASPVSSFSALEAEYGLPSGSIIRMNMTNHDNNAWARFERAEIGPEEFIDQFNQEALQQGYQIDASKLIKPTETVINRSMLEAIHWLKGRYKLALLTNNFAISTNTKWIDEVSDLFDVIVESSKVGMRKPEQRIYAHTLQLLATSAEAAVFLDDLGVNLKTARSMGIKTIKVIQPEAALEELWELLGVQPTN